MGVALEQIEKEEKGRYFIMKAFELMKKFEGIEVNKQIAKMEALAVEHGFSKEVHISRNSKIESTFYYSNNSDKVLVITRHPAYEKPFYTVIDKDVYEEYFKGTNRAVSLKTKKNKKNEIIRIVPNYNVAGNYPVHHLCMQPEEGEEIDHITHNLFINTKDTLRKCVASENSMNKCFYSRVSEKKLVFDVNDWLIDIDSRMMLVNKGYRFKGGKTPRIISPKFASMDALYAELNWFENKFLKKFRYNPLIDYSNTWYVYVLNKVIGIVSDMEASEYMRQYHIQYNPAIAEYYMLKE